MREIADQVEIDKRIHEISLLLKRKPTSYIVQYCSQKWNISKRQTYTYIKRARKEWRKYFEKLQGDGIGYHISQMKEIKDQVYERKVIIGKGENKQVFEIPDLNLVFDIAKEEAKLMGAYPAEKHEHEHKMPETVEVVHYLDTGPPPEIKERRKDDDTDSNRNKNQG